MWIQGFTPHILWEVERTITGKQHQSFKLYLASLLPTVQDDNIQESMETFLSTVQEPFYLLQRSIQEFHNIRGASKNSIKTGSPPPLFPMRRPPCPLLKTLPRSGAMNTMIPRPHLLKSCKRPNRGDGRSLWRTLSPLPPGTVRFWSLLMHWQVDPPPASEPYHRPCAIFFKKITPSPYWDVSSTKQRTRWRHVTASPPATSPTPYKNGMDAEGHAQILWSISALFYFSFSQA